MSDPRLSARSVFVRLKKKQQLLSSLLLLTYPQINAGVCVIITMDPVCLLNGSSTSLVHSNVNSATRSQQPALCNIHVNMVDCTVLVKHT
uniref:Uncharacterized protein n=1 Tax=Anguilla anguilla TaxID=7936 RepID=A0A0E9WK15_ANGAN